MYIYLLTYFEIFNVLIHTDMRYYIIHAYLLHFMLCDLILFYVTSCHAMYGKLSYAVSCYVTVCHVLCVLNYAMPCYIISRYVISCYVILYHVMLCLLFSLLHNAGVVMNLHAEALLFTGLVRT